MASLAPQVHAQGLIFDWGGEKTVDSGKQHIKFSGGGKGGDIIVSFADRKLYFITAPGEADTFPIAIPRDQSRWEGVTNVSMKKENPSWTPTAHMMRENPKLPAWVPGGHPMNPLGVRALYLGSSDYRIHGTDAPWTIGTPASKGCVRMFNKDVLDLYPRVKVGSKVTVTWQKFDGKVVAMAATAPQSKAEALAENPGLVAPKANADVEPAKAQKASFASLAADADPQQDKPFRSKYRKPSETADGETAKSAAAPQNDEPTLKKRKVRAIKADSDDATADASATDDVKPEKAEKAERVEAADKSDTSDKTDKLAKAKDEPAARSSNSVKPAKVAKPAAIETGSVDASAVNRSVAEQALAAAERAAAAAERAAAAAERAAAALTSVDRRTQAPTNSAVQ
jgi:lipoprotein-anchoring transpeptidase ErfK/SrfK